MVHKEETLVCPSVKYADQIAQCKQIHCKSCREREDKINSKLEQVEKKLKIMTIVGAIAVTVVGKDILDKIIASFSNATEAVAKIQDAAKSIDGSDAPPANSVSSINKLLRPQFPLGKGNPYPFIDGNKSAYVTELDTPFAMDPSWDKPANSPQMISFLVSTPKSVITQTNSYELPYREPQGVKNIGLMASLPRQNVFTDPPLMASYVTDSPFGGYDQNNTYWDFNSFAVPAPSTICVLFGIGCFRRRAR